MSWFGEFRALAELKRQRLALERIAAALEVIVLGQDQGRGGAGLRSFYTDPRAAEGDVFAPDDEYFAEKEAEEQERVRHGGVPEEEE